MAHIKVLIHFGGNIVNGPYGVKYESTIAPRKIKITEGTSYQEFLYAICQKLNLRFGVDHIGVSYIYQSRLVEGLYPYFSHVAITDDSDLQDMLKDASEAGSMHHAEVVVDVRADDVYIPQSHTSTIQDLNTQPRVDVDVNAAGPSEVFAVDLNIDTLESEADIDEDAALEEEDPWDEDEDEPVTVPVETGVVSIGGTSDTGGFQHQTAQQEFFTDSMDVPNSYLFWDEKKGELAKGMYFESKEAVQKAVKLYSVRTQRETVTQESNQRLWHAVCTKKHVAGIHCPWSLRAIQKKNLGWWKVTKYFGVHSCSDDRKRPDHRNLTVDIVAYEVMHFVKQKPDFEVGFVQAHIKKQLCVDISYWKAWRARNKAIELVYGSWEDSYALLPRYFRAVIRYNEGTVVKFRYWEDNPDPKTKILDYVFWAFGPCIEAWRHCRPVICIDGTHLRGKYLGHLLTALTSDAKGQIVPLAFAVVDTECNRSWTWFIQHVYNNFIQGMTEICLISDRHQGIAHAVREIRSSTNIEVKHRICLRHLKSNVYKTFKKQMIKDFCWKAGAATQPRKHTYWMEQISKTDPNGAGKHAFEYLSKIDKKKWTLSEDGGYRWGMMTTNSSECFNGVLAGARYLPITSLVDQTFLKCAEYFCNRHRQATETEDGGIVMSSKLAEKWKLWEEKSHQHRVYYFNHETGIAQVGRMPDGSGRGRNMKVVTFSTRSCTCGKWTAYHLPCSHAIAVARKNNVRLASYIPKEYSAAAYKNTYKILFQPIGDEVNWPKGPQWKLVPLPARLRDRRGGPSSNRRIHNEMDRSDTVGRRLCSRCRMPGHVITNCPMGPNM